MAENILEPSSRDLLPQVAHNLATGILAGIEQLGGRHLGVLDHIGESSREEVRRTAANSQLTSGLAQSAEQK